MLASCFFDGEESAVTARLGTDTDRAGILRLRPQAAGLMPGGNGSYLMVAEEDGRLLGFAAVFRREIPAPVARDEAFTNVIEVFEAADQRRGVASAMVRQILTVERGRRTYQVRAYCDISNIASHRLWARHGFGIAPVVIGERVVGSYVTCVLDDPC